MDFMSIIKFQVSIPEAVKAIAKFKENRLKAFSQLSEDVRTSVEETFNHLLNLEMSLFLGEADQADNKRNGYKERDFTLKGIGTIRINLPQDRKSRFESSIIPKSERFDPRVKEDIAVLHLAGISNRTLSMISKRILGLEVSKTTVQESLSVIQDSAINWLERPIADEYWALYIDGTNFRIQRRGSTEKEPSLVVLGIDKKDHRSVLAIEAGHKDNVDSWRSVFDSLVRRGLDPRGVKIGVMDGLPGLETAFKETFTEAVTGRCWVHSMKNALNKCPARLRDAFKALLTTVMYAESLQEAKDQFKALKRDMGSDGQRAVSCIEKDLDSLLAHYSFEKSYWRTLKTTNPIERINKELKRRTKSMETLGESTLTAVVAFTALKLEMGWRMYKVNDPRHEKLDRLWKTNVIEGAINQLTH
jgi:putative transposase